MPSLKDLFEKEFPGIESPFIGRTERVEILDEHTGRGIILEVRETGPWEMDVDVIHINADDEED